MNLRFYYCDVCKKIVVVLPNTEIPTFCCGQPMRELIPNKTDGTFEKHVPVWSIIGNQVIVNVGSEPHPMNEHHRITWIGLSTNNGFQWKELQINDQPKAQFYIEPGEKIKSIFAFCNIHGLWSSDV